MRRRRSRPRKRPSLTVTCGPVMNPIAARRQAFRHEAAHGGGPREGGWVPPAPPRRAGRPVREWSQWSHWPWRLFRYGIRERLEKRREALARRRLGIGAAVLAQLPRGG